MTLTQIPAHEQWDVSRTIINDNSTSIDGSLATINWTLANQVSFTGDAPADWDPIVASGATGKILKKEAKGTAFNKSFGTGSGTVAEWNDSRLPTTDEKAALAGEWTPSAGNKLTTKSYVDTAITNALPSVFTMTAWENLTTNDPVASLSGSAYKISALEQTLASPAANVLWRFKMTDTTFIDMYYLSSHIYAVAYLVDTGYGTPVDVYTTTTQKARWCMLTWTTWAFMIEATNTYIKWFTLSGNTITLWWATSVGSGNMVSILRLSDTCILCDYFHATWNYRARLATVITNSCALVGSEIQSMNLSTWLSSPWFASLLSSKTAIVMIWDSWATPNIRGYVATFDTSTYELSSWGAQNSTGWTSLMLAWLKMKSSTKGYLSYYYSSGSAIFHITPITVSWSTITSWTPIVTTTHVAWGGIDSIWNYLIVPWTNTIIIDMSKDSIVEALYWLWTAGDPSLIYLSKLDFVFWYATAKILDLWYKFLTWFASAPTTSGQTVTIKKTGDLMANWTSLTSWVKSSLNTSWAIVDWTWAADKTAVSSWTLLRDVGVAYNTTSYIVNIS